jgi:hypothetical protein
MLFTLCEVGRDSHTMVPPGRRRLKYPCNGIFALPAALWCQGPGIASGANEDSLEVQIMRSRERAYGSKFLLEPSPVAMTANHNESIKQKGPYNYIHRVAPIFSASASLLFDCEMAVTFAPKALAKSTPKWP